MFAAARDYRIGARVLKSNPHACVDSEHRRIFVGESDRQRFDPIGGSISVHVPATEHVGRVKCVN